MGKFQKIIFILFAFLIFLVPLVLWPYTSEVFEFNKVVLLYILTTLITGIWVVRSLIERKIIFRRTILDIPLLVFIGSQLISTIFSIDPLTSWLGYYSRFNGGLASIICYCLLYWAFVSNFWKQDAIKLIKILLSSATLVSLYGILEHFGIDKDIWVQDVQSRVFSTLGQPNWLAAWLVALMPIGWALRLNPRHTKNWLWITLSALFFTTLLFTKSRSGLLGFVVANFIFWGLVLLKYKKQFLREFIIHNSLFLILFLLIGSPFRASNIQPPISPGIPSLETGGTESGTIRKIVWKGATQVWLHYPVFGSGVETFAFTYYKFRPVEHNLVSEWDFIYNKAHNQFLNTAANSGTTGLLSYLFLIGASVYLFTRKFENSEEGILNLALLAGFVSLSATNFFGFAVVPTELTFFLFPAFAIAIAGNSTEYQVRSKKLENTQKMSTLFVLCTLLYVLFSVGKYWYADTLFAKGKAFNASKKPDQAIKYLGAATRLEPNQALYHNELGSSLTNIALTYNEQKDTTNSKKFADMAIAESDKAVSLSPANVNLKKARFGVFIMLSVIDQNYLLNAQNTLVETINQSPTDAKLYYNLGLTYARTGQSDKALDVLKKTIGLKSNYKDARLAYAILLIEKGDKTGAKAQLEYILGSIDPNDFLTKQTLESIK